MIKAGLLSFIFAFGFLAWAQDTTTPAPTDKQETSQNTGEPSKGNLDDLQKKYNLTPEEIKTLTDSKIKQHDYARIAALARGGNKTLSEVIAMRADQKMGWGKIAKTLGVHPSEIGQAVSEGRHDRHHGRDHDRHDKAGKADKMEKAHGKGHGK